MENIEKNENFMTEEIVETPEQVVESVETAPEPKTYTEEEFEAALNARLTEIEKKVLNLRRAEKTIVAIAFELNTCESNVNKIIKRIKRKIVMCIMFGD